MGKPDADKAAKNALAPGIDSILAPMLIDCLISLYAGSEIPGVPASVMTAIFWPLDKLLIGTEYGYLDYIHNSLSF